MYQLVRDRELSPCSERHCRHVLSSNTACVQRMELQQRLEGHHGCVNTVAFDTEAGNILISGSDDMQIMLWDWERGTPRLTFSSGHTNNVFQARMMPHNGGSKIVTCAADGQVRLCELPEGASSSSVTKSLLGQHYSRAHKLAVDPLCPAHCFYSCGEDGLVLHYDLRCGTGVPDRGGTRAPGGTSSSSTGGSRSGARRKLLACRGYSRSRGMTREVCGINAIHVNPLLPWHFALGAADPWTRVYDVRRTRDESTSDMIGPLTRQQAQGRIHHSTSALSDDPVALLCPHHLSSGASPGSLIGDPHVTCVAYSKQGELLASYNDEDIFLFGSQAAKGSSGGSSSSRQRQEDGSNGSGSNGSGSGSAQQATGAGVLQQQQQQQQQQQGPQGSNKLSPSRRPRAAAEAADTAATAAAAAADGSSGVRYVLEEEEEGRPRWRRRQRLVSAAEAAAAPAAGGGGSDAAAAAAAGGSDAAAGGAGTGHLDVMDVQQHQQLDQEEGGTQQQQQEQPPPEQHPKQQQQQQLASGAELSPGDTGDTHRQQRSSAGLSPTPAAAAAAAGQQPSESLTPGLTTAGAVAAADGSPPPAAAAAGEAGAAAAAAAPRVGGIHLPDAVSAYEAVPGGRFYGTDSSSRDGVVASYFGHRNAATVKGVSFFGEDDEYVCSGSDCGHVFLWDKVRGTVVLWEEADTEVVNCLEPHPRLPLVLATSGIEHDIKVWGPTAPRPMPPPAAALRRAMAANQRARQSARDAYSEPEHWLVQLLAAQRRRTMARRRRAAAAETATAAAGTPDQPAGGAGTAAAAAAAAAEESDDEEELLLPPGGVRIVWSGAGGRHGRRHRQQEQGEEGEGDGGESEGALSSSEDDGADSMDEDSDGQPCQIS